MSETRKVKKKKKAARKASAIPRNDKGRFVPRPGLKRKAEDYREHMAICRRRLMSSCSENVIGDIVNQLIRDCTHEEPDVRHAAMRLLFDRVFGKAPVYTETKTDTTTQFVKEIILTTPELARPPVN